MRARVAPPSDQMCNKRYSLCTVKRGEIDGFWPFFWPFFFNCAGCMNGIIFTIGSFEQFTLCAKPVKFLPFFPVSYYFFFF